MNHTQIALKILTPESIVLDESVDSVRLTSTDGQLGILPNHQPLVTPLETGLLWIKQHGKERVFSVMAGLFKTDGETATVLTEAAEASDQIDVLRAKTALQRAEGRLKDKANAVDSTRAEMALKRAMTRLNATGQR
jgi:F-type H+-transporting ATPase subunit epsilon